MIEWTDMDRHGLDGQDNADGHTGDLMTFIGQHLSQIGDKIDLIVNDQNIRHNPLPLDESSDVGSYSMPAFGAEDGQLLHINLFLL